MPKVYFVVPCYNEEEVLNETIKRLTEKLQTLIATGRADENSRMLFVDDGSKDKTWSIIEEHSRINKYVGGVKLSRNRGHQNALLSGLMTAREQQCDCVISLDADLQDDIEVLDEFIDKYMDGCEVVYGVRNSRKKDTFFKRTTAQGYYKFMKALGVDIVYNHADYRLMGSRALDALADYKEVNLFLRGIVPLIGYRHDYVYYERNERFAGESKYPLKKMLKFAFDGITSFSVKPLKLITKLGIITCVLSLIGFIYAIVSWCLRVATAGWASIICSIWFIGGLQMLCIGIVGSYVGKIYGEVKQRPRYRIETTIINEDTAPVQSSDQTGTGKE